MMHGQKNIKIKQTGPKSQLHFQISFIVQTMLHFSTFP